MTKFVNIHWILALCSLVQLFASLDVIGAKNIDNHIKEIQKITHSRELLAENATIKEPESCQSNLQCSPGGTCNGKGLYGKVCKCFPGVSGDYCKTIEECVINPRKCGYYNDVECSYDPFYQIPYCKCCCEERRFDVKLKRCVDQKPCEEDKDCQHSGECKGDCVKYCKCRPGTYGDYCEKIEECETNPNLCGSGDDVKCKYNYFLKRAFCHCLNGTYRFDIKQKKCIERKPCNSQEECGKWGVCTEKCQSFEPCKDDEYFEDLRSCHCTEGTSGEKCEIVDDCYNKVVDCGIGENVECKYRYKSGISGSSYCECTKDNQSFDKASKVCKDCKCGEGSDSCEFKGEKKFCFCKPDYLVNNEICEKCDCGNDSNWCAFEKGIKICSCKPGFAMGNYGVCTPICSHSQQCKNGGRCLQNICVCPTGTSGPYCESIYECENKLCGEKKDVYCKYNTHTEKAYCQCQNTDAIYDPFDKTCKMCSCDTFNNIRYKISWESCEFLKGRKLCHCKKGYAHEPKLDICYQCDCGIHGTCRFKNTSVQLSSSIKVCDCKKGYEDFQGTCFKCDCGPNGKCVFNSRGETFRCDCDLGFSEESKKCKFCYCGPNSKCSYKNKRKVCECPEGYQNINGFCKDIDECLEAESCPEPGMLCLNTQGSFRCECKPGYVYKHTDKNNSTSGCEKEQVIQPDYSIWKIGYGAISAGFLLIFICLVVIIFKIRRNSTYIVRQSDISLSTTKSHF